MSRSLSTDSDPQVVGRVISGAMAAGAGRSVGKTVDRSKGGDGEPKVSKVVAKKPISAGDAPSTPKKRGNGGGGGSTPKKR